MALDLVPKVVPKFQKLGNFWGVVLVLGAPPKFGQNILELMGVALWQPQNSDSG